MARGAAGAPQLRCPVAGRTVAQSATNAAGTTLLWCPKETYRIVNNNEFTEVFELAALGNEFEVYLDTKFKRKGYH
jgi:hypothetical protein